MKRNSTIASVAAATGIVGATVIAAISLMQATVTDGSENETITLAAATATNPMPSELVFTPEPLPEIPVISDSAPEIPVISGSAPKNAVTSGSAPKNAVISDSATPSSSEPQSSLPITNQVTRDFATQAVVNATEGTVTSVEIVTRNGIDSFAVTVNRTDGSVITGYVDRSTGDIYEWVVVKEAPVPTPTPAKQYVDDEHEEDDYEDEKHEEDHDEEEDDDERDNDDD
jgi:hypothetical protein